MIGEFEKGWADYEARKDIPGALGPARPLDIPPWLGETDLAGQTILLHCEQGMGDGAPLPPDHRRGLERAAGAHYRRIAGHDRPKPCLRRDERPRSLDINDTAMRSPLR
jgi:hypothetical protein